MPKTKSVKADFKHYISAESTLPDLEKVRFIRNWINTNSIHLIDAEHDLYAFKNGRVIKLLWEQHLHNHIKKPHLSCGPRSYAMHELLKAVNIKSRIIDIFKLKNTR